MDEIGIEVKTDTRGESTNGMSTRAFQNFPEVLTATDKVATLPNHDSPELVDGQLAWVVSKSIIEASNTSNAFSPSLHYVGTLDPAPSIPASLPIHSHTAGP